jgi:invasion protein IalB
MALCRLSVLGSAFAICLPVLPASAQTARPAPQAAPSTASAPKAGATTDQTFLLGTFNDWKALVSGKDKGKVCFVLAQPVERKPANLKRDPAYLFISSRPGDGARNEIAIKLGFAAKSGLEGSISLGAAKFALSTSAENAFLKNPAQEALVLDAMRKGSEVIVKATSLKGNETTDRYSLNGFLKALERMAKECP